MSSGLLLRPLLTSALPAYMTRQRLTASSPGCARSDRPTDAYAPSARAWTALPDPRRPDLRKHPLPVQKQAGLLGWIHSPAGQAFA